MWYVPWPWRKPSDTSPVYTLYSRRRGGRRGRGEKEERGERGGGTEGGKEGEERNTMGREEE